MKQVIDTNVILVANGQHEDVSNDCIEKCIEELIEARKHVTVVDDGYRIIREYLHKTRPNQPKGPGDAFLKWLLNNQNNKSCVEAVRITEQSEHVFEEFPDVDLQNQFDPPDRKFIAVAHAHQDKPSILQAADCKWIDWWQRLADFGLHVRFICKQDVSRFYARKFPERTMPPLPGE